MKKQKGLTLVELLVVIAMMAVLGGVGIPSFQALLDNNRLVTDTNSLVLALQLARSEAVKRNIPTRVCSLNAARDDCSVNASWENGWLVQAISSPAITIRSWSDITSGTAINFALNDVTFSGDGTATAGGDMQLASYGNSYCVFVTASGQIRSAKGACPP